VATEDVSKHAVMVVNLDSLLAAICSAPNQFSRERFYGALSRVKDIKDTSQSYWSLASKLHLIEAVQGEEYKRSPLGAKICKLRTKENKNKLKDTTELKKTLANVFLLHEPGFADFLKFMKQPRSQKEILDEFNRFSGATLIEWAISFGSIEFAPAKRQYYLVKTPEVMPTPDEFWNWLQTAYEELRLTQMVGIKAAFVQIPELRDFVCASKGLRRKQFNIQLGVLIDDPRFRSRIELSGAPLVMILEDAKVKSEEELEEPTMPLIYRGRMYYFIAFKGGADGTTKTKVR
jgi:hypothetical protein